MKGAAISYSDQELAWIKAHSSEPRRVAHAAFCLEFGRADVSPTNFNALYKRNGWLTGRTGRFDPGCVPLNKGVPCPPGKGGRHPNAQRTQFRKGATPHTYRGAGHERVCKKDGYVILIVEETNPWTGAKTRPVHKHRYLWEQANGPIPEGMFLKCLDGDKLNTDPSNWEALPRQAQPYLNSHRGIDYEASEPELRPAIIALAKVRVAAKVATRKAGTA